MFVSAFSLRDVYTCDLIQVLKYQVQETYTESKDTTELKDIDSDGNNCRLKHVRQHHNDHDQPSNETGHNVLVVFAKTRNASC